MGLHDLAGLRRSKSQSPAAALCHIRTSGTGRSRLAAAKSSGASAQDLQALAAGAVESSKFLNEFRLRKLKIPGSTLTSCGALRAEGRVAQKAGARPRRS